MKKWSAPKLYTEKKNAIESIALPEKASISWIQINML